MPYDITLCHGQGCPVKENCVRSTQEVLGRQNFFGQLPYNFALNTCDYFISNRPNVNQIRKLAYEIWIRNGCQEGKAVEYWLQAEKQLTEWLKS
jgi:hypothetical protein